MNEWLINRKTFLLLVLQTLFTTVFGQVYNSEAPFAHTFSIVARDSITGDMAVGVQSHWFSVGTVVSYGKAGAGVVATQSFVDKSYGPKGITLMAQNVPANKALASLLEKDSGREVRQVAMIDHNGVVAAHTGKNCIDYASHITGDNFSVQSNMMLTNTVCESMAKAFRESYGQSLANRVLAALKGGQSAGGDIRGKQSAVILVISGKPQVEEWNERLVDIRVDDSAEPLKELERLLRLHEAYTHMNNGDLAVEKNDMNKAMEEYNAAMNMFPENLEMQYWTAITLANNKQADKAVAMLQKIYKRDPNWRELTKRLPKVNLLTVSPETLKLLLQ